MSGCGIVLVLSDDPISRIVTAITKQEFSTIGCYYYYKPTNTIQVFVTDPFGFPIYGSDLDLRSLVENPIVRRVVLRPLLPIVRKGVEDKNQTQKREEIFRLTLTQARRKGPLTNTKECLYQLFGFPSGNFSQRGLSSLGLMELIMKKIGSCLPQSKINTIYGSGYEWCISPPTKQKSVDAVIQLLSYLASNLNQQTSAEVTTDGTKLPAQIQSYIIDETIFGPFEEISIVENLKRRDALLKIFKEQMPRIEKTISCFLSLLSDPGFFYLVAKGTRNQSLELLQTSLIECIQSKTSLLTEVADLLPENKLQTYLSDLNFERSKASALIGDVFETSENLDEIGQKKSRKKDCQDSIEELRDLVSELIEKQEPFDVRRLLQISNSLSSNVGLEELFFPVKKVKGQYFLSPEQIGVVLKSGDRLNLPLRDVDLSRFDYETLVEILDSLDGLANDPTYDEIRTRIAEELASYSSQM
nr:hypothetical protein pmam_87 [Pithovirus mammoth]